MLLISDLVNELDSYLSKESVANIYQAYLFGAQAHDGQKRKSGEPYIYHPIAVAHILAGMRCDASTITAAILHDVIEDTGVGKERVASEFGDEVAHMVDGVSKLGDIQSRSAKQAQADNFRKMMLAMTSDLRVIIIKIADRLHNMRTLHCMPTEKRKRIALETMDVYIPLADRLGMYEIKNEFENLVLQSLRPLRYRILEQAMRKFRGRMYDINQDIKESIESNIARIGVETELKYREKSLFSIYNKMREQGLKFSEVDDIYALRIITTGVDECYRILGVLHGLYKPMLGKFKDYIAIPKVNGYQSLHTVLFVRDDYKFEVQIRTRQMDYMAESGIAAHWQYKARDKRTGESYFDKTTRKWMRQISELQHTAVDSEEFLESVKVDLFSDKVFVFSPKGKIFELPRGATVLDFAYAIHTEVGDHCKAANINNKPVYIGTELKNGQTVRIITDDKVRPVPSWLDIVATGRASSSIKSSLRKMKSQDLRGLGRKILSNGLARYDLSFEDISDSGWQKLLSDLNLEDLDALYHDLGIGNRIPDVVIGKLVSGLKGAKRPSRFRSIIDLVTFSRSKPDYLEIAGTEGMAIQYARCCLPLPGDKIVGYISSGRGIVVHEYQCNNLKRHNKYSENLAPLKWSENISREFETEIHMTLKNRPGVLAMITTEISKEDSNINSVETARVANKFGIGMLISVRDRQHLARIIKAVRKLSVVKSINRVKNIGHKK